MPKFSPFHVQFDKPTWGLVKDAASIINGNCVDAVILAVRVAYVVLSKPETMLSELGQSEIKRVVKVFRDPTGVNKPAPRV